MAMTFFGNASYWAEYAWRGYGYSADGKLFCETEPAIASSYGVWERIRFPKLGLSVLDYGLPQLEIAMVVVLFLWQLFYYFFKKIGLPLPKITAMMLAGAALSQASLLPNDSILQLIFFPDDNRPKLPETLGGFAFVFYWFLEGVKMDVAMVKRTGYITAVTGVITVIFPIVAANLTFGSLRETGSKYLTGAEYRIMVFMQSISAFTGISKLIRELKIDHSEFGRMVLSTAMVADGTGIAVNIFAILSWSDWKLSLYEVLGLAGFAMSGIFIARPAMFRIIKRTPENRPVKEAYVYAILILAFFSYGFVKKIGLFPALGPFFLGLCVPHGPPLGSLMIQKFESFNTGIILPLIVFFPMLQIDGPWLVSQVHQLRHHHNGTLYEALFIIGVVSIAKIVFSTIPPLLARKMPLKDSFVMALILNNKGIVELCYFTYAVESQAIEAKTFTIVAVMILISSTALPIFINFMYDPSKRLVCFQKRNLMSLKVGSELKFVIGIHKSDNIGGMINLIDQTFPLVDPLLTCYVLQLVELAGSDSPLFISHQMQTAEYGSRSYSSNVLIAFDRFKHYWKSMSLELFTSISNPKYMHEEIYALALDKQASFIMLPFHRVWSLDQTTIVSDDATRRNANINVLAQAPCSVGIFASRQNALSTMQKTDSEYKVCVIFVGGRDDREALALGRQMMRNENVNLTLLKFVPMTMEGMSVGWDEMLDNAEIKETIRNNESNLGGEHSFVQCVEETVKDGTETSLKLLPIASNYDLFVVGRSSGMGTDVTKALTEWTEFDELGVIGDLLVSSDFPQKASVLVVQQQQNVAGR